MNYKRLVVAPPNETIGEASGWDYAIDVRPDYRCYDIKVARLIIHRYWSFAKIGPLPTCLYLVISKIGQPTIVQHRADHKIPRVSPPLIRY